MTSSGFSLEDSVQERLLRNRVIFLGSEVSDEVANRLCSQLLLLSAEDPASDISFYINSPGGSVDAGMAIYDTMKFVGCDIATFGLGRAHSMGQFLLTCGTKGKRHALKHTKIIMHQPSGGIIGSSSDIQIMAEQARYTKKLMTELIAQHTGQTYDKVLADADRDRMFTAEQAKEYGMIDHIITGPHAMPVALPS